MENVILEAVLENDKYNFKYDKQNVTAIKEILQKIRLSMSPNENNLKDTKYAFIKIKALNRYEVSIESDSSSNEALFNLIGFVLGELNKSPVNNNLLDTVTISSDYIAKYNEWIKKIAKKNITNNINDIKDETAYVDKKNNLVIVVEINNKKYEFKIPHNKWSF